jgi:hypothetical protein
MGKYGLLQESLSVDDKDYSQVSEIAANKLRELNRISETTSIDLLGDDRVKSGRILAITEPITKLAGYYLVKEATHTVQNSIHKMSLDIEVFTI